MRKVPFCLSLLKKKRILKKICNSYQSGLKVIIKSSMESDYEQGPACYTHAVEYKVTYTWHIKDFESFYTSSRCHVQSITSSVFCRDDDPGTRWVLQLFPKGDKDAIAHASNSPGENISFFINLDKSSDVSEMYAKYSVNIVGQGQSPQKVSGENTFKRGSGWGRSRFVKLEELLRDKSVFLAEDTFCVRCTIEYTKSVTMDQKARDRSISNASTVTGKIINTDGINSPNSHLASGKGVYQQPMPWHDVTLLVGGNEIYAHRWILASSCPALAQLVSGQDATVEVEAGVDPDTFSQMIRFIYTGEVDLVTEGNAYKLLAVASKYRLLSLMTKCENHLLASLDKNNCYITYSWADISCAGHLKTEAAKIIESLGFVGSSKVGQASGSNVPPV